MQTETSNKWLKSINQQKVLRLIFIEGPISRVELAKRTGLTQQTVTNIVNRLLSEEIVVERSPITSGSGRRPVPLIINGANMFAIGIEVAVKYVRGTLRDFNNRQVKEITEYVTAYESEEHPLRCISKVIDGLLSHIPDKIQLKGIGCSIQGLVDSRQGIVIYSPGLQWRQFPLKEKLEEMYDSPVHLENDANLLALVENLNGHLAESHNNITLKFDHGIGGAIVINKKLCSGATHVAGEFGHYKAFEGENAKLCHCGAKGCLTTLASVSGLKRNARISPEDLYARLLADDPEANRLFADITSAVGGAISNIITFINPESVLLTGKLFDKLRDVFIPSLSKYIAATVPETCQGVNLIYLPETPDESTSAAGLVMNQFFDVPLEQLP
ncbi:putative NBD/HSP70 family sugar kinase [Scopulibacillus darangshiensis]|uniref:Putative NBD/HSP70 family sugar kinase n=1 Tax=Scopulibacillus darangshiensis TaxID=442528 RepID=A0A4R2NJX6_9BACL|nr:ROK family transcriptional regulator [Scopulibacillus darangshiensis]TCP21879.1 putative NBD/HSP70 family sugar kinase [Scopulibacillus darangshiensis]